MRIRQIPPNRSTNKNGRDHAVVIGGSMAGMLAARVLADHFELVTLLERDPYSEEAEHRKGLPQSHHLHALLARGLQIIEQLFPGIRDELIATGAQVLDIGADLAWRTPRGWGKRFKSSLTFLSFSRPFLDWHIRRRLQEVPNVKFLSNYEVTALVSNSERNGVSGVSVRSVSRKDDTNEHENAMSNGGQFIHADLVVDASGRQSRAPQWLKSLGYDLPRETVVNAFLGYATRLYQRPKTENKEWHAIFLQAAPPKRTRSGIMFPIENDRWILTLCGGDRDYPPADEQEFIRFAESLPSQMISDIIRDARPVSPIRSFRNTQNRLRHYDEMLRFPAHFVLLGDSVCAFNPVYGQGMTIAAMGAVELQRSLAEWGQDSLGVSFTRNFQKKLAKINSLPWALATGEDCRYRGTEGASRTWRARLMHAYLDRVVALTTRDINVRTVWLTVFQMLKPPSSLFHPAVLFKVIRDIIAPSRLLKATEMQT